MAHTGDVNRGGVSMSTNKQPLNFFDIYYQIVRGLRTKQLNYILTSGPLTEYVLIRRVGEEC